MKNNDTGFYSPLAKAAGVVIPEWNSEIVKIIVVLRVYEFHIAFLQANEMKDHEDVVFLEAGCYPLLQYKMVLYVSL